MTMSAKIMDQLAARGLDPELAINYGFDSQVRDGGDVLVIPSFRGDRVVRRKYRTLGGEKKFWADKGGLRCVWNENALKDESLISQPLIITEGELDALAAIQAGFPRTISVPDGAPNAPAEDPTERKAHDWVNDIRGLIHRDRVETIILAVDNDGPGAALLQDLSVLLGRFRCKFLIYPFTEALASA